MEGFVGRQRRERAEGLRPFGHGPQKFVCRCFAHFDGETLFRQFIEPNYIRLSPAEINLVSHTGIGGTFLAAIDRGFT